MCFCFRDTKQIAVHDTFHAASVQHYLPCRTHNLIFKDQISFMFIALYLTKNFTQIILVDMI